jgi:hypothetical protein
MALMGSLAALVTDLLAPGNYMKLVNNGGVQVPGLFEIIRQTFSSAEHFFSFLFVNSLRPMLCILGIPALVAFGFHPQLDRKPSSRDLAIPAVFLALFAVIILVVYWICFIPAFTVLRVSPPLRSLVVMFSWLSLTLGIESYALGMTINRLAQWMFPSFHRAGMSKVIRISTALATLVLLILGPLQSAQKLLRVLPVYRQFASEWELRDQMARQAVAEEMRNVVLPRLDDLYGLGPEVSGQFELYYGLPGPVTFEMISP